MTRPTFDPQAFADKTVFVTGGAQGIGLACAGAFARCGADVVIADLHPEPGQEAAEAIGARYTQLDVRDTASVRAAIADAYGVRGRLDIAVNCAGIRHGGHAEGIPDEEWDGVQAVNVAGVYKCCREQGKIMIRHGGGAIVNIASMSGSVVNRPQNQSAYNASKAAVVMLTKSLAVEWAGHGIRVNSVSPGYTATAQTAASLANPEKLQIWLDRTPLGRVAQPHEIAAAVQFLASPAASFILGHDLLVDGGYTAT